MVGWMIDGIWNGHNPNPPPPHPSTYIHTHPTQPLSDVNNKKQALHENFLLLRYTDPTLAKTAAAAEWLAFSDLAQGRQMEAQVKIVVLLSRP